MAYKQVPDLGDPDDQHSRAGRLDSATSLLEVDATWSSFCKDMLANVEYIFNHEPTSLPYSDEHVSARLLATRAHLLATAAELGVRYNSCRPVSRLPAELFHRIFRHVASVYPPQPYDAGLDKPGHLGWISLAHVCQRWRTILLDMPSLWATCVCVFPRAMKDYVSRAQRSLITLELDIRRVRPPLAPSVFQTALSYIRLGATISFTLPAHFQETLIYVLTTYDLPCAESLSISILRDPKEKSLPSSQMDLPRLQAPKLRRCYMTNLLVPLAASALTHLELVRDTTKETGFPSAEAFIGIFSRAPYLEVLHIENWIPDCTHLLSRENLRLVSLTRLRSLSLASTPARCESFWRIVQVSQTAVLTLDIHRASRAPEDLAAVYSLLNAIAPHMQPSSTDALENQWGLSLDEDGDLSFHLRLLAGIRENTVQQDATSTAISSPFDHSYAERLRVRLTLGTRFEWTEELPSLLSAFGVPSTRINILAIRMHPPTVSSRWQIFLRHFSTTSILHVRSFTVDDEPQTGLVSALMMEPFIFDVSGGGGSSRGWLLPNLHELWMRDVVLEEPSGRRSTFQERLLDILRARSLKRLRIARMPTDVDAFPDAARVLQEDFIMRAKELISVVEWNRGDEKQVSIQDYKRSWDQPWREE